MFPVTARGDANHCLTVATTAIKSIIHAAFSPTDMGGGRPDESGKEESGASRMDR